MADNSQLYQTFVQKNGSRKGQSFKLKRGKSGLLERVYANGDTADAEQRKVGLGGRLSVPTPKPRKKPPMGLGGRGLGS
jgi:hypothetical protein